MMVGRTYPPDPRVDEAKVYPVAQLIERLALANMRRRSDEMVGPCPNCGGDDRFNVRISTGQFLCHQCDLRGGDQIALVMECERLAFPDALKWLIGDRPADPAEVERRQKAAAKSKKTTDAANDQFRKNAIASAKAIWRGGVDATATQAHAYLEARGISREMLPIVPAAIRFHPTLDYREKGKDGWQTIHTGPAMLAKMVQPDGSFGGVHRTWLDLSKPKGKIQIELFGEFRAKNKKDTYFDAKKTLGSKKGGTIRLSLPSGADTMVVGEGIETTFTAMVSGVFPDAAFVCAIDLGNMAGERVAIDVPGKRPSKRLSTIPDLSDCRALVPPKWVKRLIYIQDGDSDPDFTRAQLNAGLQRAMAMRPGIQCQIWPAPCGLDLNDALIGSGA